LFLLLSNAANAARSVPTSALSDSLNPRSVLPSAKAPTLAEILTVETGVLILARTLPSSRRGCANRFRNGVCWILLFLPQVAVANNVALIPRRRR
jgi:hypothetical protein